MNSKSPDQRITRIFQRFHQLHSTLCDDKSNKFKMLLNHFSTFEKTLHELQESRADRLQALVDRLSRLDRHAAQLAVTRDRNSALIAEALLKADKNCKNSINNYIKERSDRQRKLDERLNGLFKKCRTELESAMEGDNFLQQLAKYEAVIPTLEEDLVYQSQLRAEIESKIHSQFVEQIGELKQMFQQECRDRQEQHDNILKVLKQLYNRVAQALRREQAQREANEALLLGVVEQLVDKIGNASHSL